MKLTEIKAMADEVQIIHSLDQVETLPRQQAWRKLGNPSLARFIPDRLRAFGYFGYTEDGKNVLIILE